jgi:glycosyltransferase involved in cell wall biosynthesis
MSPSVSVVIPAYNASATLAATLAAIAAQSDGADFEVIVADNGSTDDTRVVAELWSDRLPVRVVDASEKRGVAAARNIAAREALGDLLVFTDADDCVFPGWLAAWTTLDPIVEFASGPVFPFREEAAPSAPTSLARDLPSHMGFRRYAVGANFAVRASVLARSGGFDESMPPAEDIEMSWRLQLSGVSLVFVPEAALAKRERGGVRAIVRQYYRYGLADPVLYRRYRSAGVPKPRLVAMLKSYGSLIARLPVLHDDESRVRWARQVGRRAGRLVGSVRERVFYP